MTNKDDQVPRSTIIDRHEIYVIAAKTAIVSLWTIFNNIIYCLQLAPLISNSKKTYTWQRRQTNFAVSLSSYFLRAHLKVTILKHLTTAR